MTSKAQRRRAGRKRNIAPTIAASPWDHGAMGQANRHGLVIEERGEVDPKTGKIQNPNCVTGVRRYDMLEIYHKRGWISTAGYNAGCLLRMAWLKVSVGTCPPWLRERVDSSPKPDAAVAIQIDRVSALLKVSRMVPVEDERIVSCVCCDGNAIGALREYRGRKHEDGKAHLKIALDRLSERIEGLARKSRTC
ncbi:hypothetical protein PE067_09305 [Paracoccus sp. DMF-8]|uniref:hypothetical protein n=1 Tax=Paracoccus sp. DMF-8 TaxID=3019445 RepID=UPI0023E8E9E6|nr:hypothetical protein [Paracoccus sp. DMF-8]MDF3606315.1 hypothetical protein [Paracoccus sp. DMF-8]